MQQKTKAPKPKNVSTPKKTVKKKKKAKKKGISFSSVVSIILILAIMGVIAVLYFDLLGSNQILADFLELEKPTQEQLDELAAKKLEIATQEEELNNEIFNNNKLASEIEDMQSDLDLREAKIAKDEEELAARQAEWDVIEKDLTAEVKMFELMESEKAATAIAKMSDVTAIIRLLKSMSSEKAAEILNYLDSKVTADVLNIIMEEIVPVE